MPQLCQQCHQSFEIRDKDREFYQKISTQAQLPDIMPPPTLCTDHRLQRRMSWRNDVNLYKRTCDATGKEMISMYRPDSPLTVYHQDIWWSDQWDGLQYGRDFDFNRPFFEQFQELNEKVPQMSLIAPRCENSPYNNYTTNNKNCYLCFAGNNSQDCFYAYNAEKCRDCADCLFVYDSELCYECVHCENCYNCDNLLHCKNCSESAFLEDCTGCSNCFLCFNLQRKQFCILNKQYTKEEYHKILKTYALNTREGREKAKKLWQEERLRFPKPESHNIRAENCTGEYISNSKNCEECYIMMPNCEDCTYVFNGFPGLKDAYDCTYCGENSQLLYESMGTGVNGMMLFFCNICLYGCSYLQYCNFVMSSHHCFGCSNLRNQSYCILNKKYEQSEYEKLLPRIIDHMKKTGEYGQFFPQEISPFRYEETMAASYFTGSAQ